MFAVGRVLLGWGVESLLIVLTSFITPYYRDGYLVTHSLILDLHARRLSMALHTRVRLRHLVRTWYLKRVFGQHRRSHPPVDRPPHVSHGCADRFSCRARITSRTQPQIFHSKSERSVVDTRDPPALRRAGNPDRRAPRPRGEKVPGKPAAESRAGGWLLGQLFGAAGSVQISPPVLAAARVLRLRLHLDPGAGGLRPRIPGQTLPHGDREPRAVGMEAGEFDVGHHWVGYSTLRVRGRQIRTAIIHGSGPYYS